MGVLAVHALDLLLDDTVGIVSIGGRAGTGKSALALCAGLESVLERGEHKRIIVFRPLYAVGGQNLGYLPGDEMEKMNPWSQAVYDTLEGVVSDNVLDEVASRDLLEVLPDATHWLHLEEPEWVVELILDHLQRDG